MSSVYKKLFFLQAKLCTTSDSVIVLRLKITRLCQTRSEVTQQGGPRDQKELMFSLDVMNL